MIAKDAEEFVRWYLRFNGYFSIESFIIHKADTPTKGGIVPQRTECDLLAVRLPYSREMSGPLHIVNHSLLTDDSSGKVDLVICEIKTGNDNRPNPVWINAKTQKEQVLKYIVQFFGAIQREDDEFEKACGALAKQYRYDADKLRIRYIVFSNEEHVRHRKRGVMYITYQSIIDFLVEDRGMSWSENEIGKASQHQQWTQIIKDTFVIINNETLSVEQRKNDLKELLKF